MLKRYDLKSTRETHEGWAIIVIDAGETSGFFSVVSDFGNYAYLWTSTGCEFRKFLLGLDTDYLRKKLLHGNADKLRVFDGDATKAAIRSALEERDSGLRRTEQELRALDRRSFNDETDFQAWQSETVLDEPWTYAVWQPDPQCTAFCERVFPRFKKLLEEELTKEEQDKKDAEILRQNRGAIVAAVKADLDQSLTGAFNLRVDPLCPTSECVGTCDPEKHGL